MLRGANLSIYHVAKYLLGERSFGVLYKSEERDRNAAHHVPVRMCAESSLRLHQIIVHNAQDLPKEVSDGARRGGSAAAECPTP